VQRRDAVAQSLRAAERSRRLNGQRHSESDAREHGERQLAETFFTHVDCLAALGAMDLPVLNQGGEDHVFEGFAVPKSVRWAVVEHPIENIHAGSLRRRRESAEAIAAA
jgi:hypothetical protein